MLPGGQINPDLLRVEPKAIALIKDIFDQKKIVAAVCHAPWLLIEAGIAKGRKMTSYKSIKTDVINAGAKWEDSEVVVDKGVITSRNPGDLNAFSAKIIEEISEGKPASEAQLTRRSGLSAALRSAFPAKAGECGGICVMVTTVAQGGGDLGWTSKRASARKAGSQWCASIAATASTRCRPKRRQLTDAARSFEDDGDTSVVVLTGGKRASVPDLISRTPRARRARPWISARSAGI